MNAALMLIGVNAAMAGLGTDESGGGYGARSVEAVGPGSRGLAADLLRKDGALCSFSAETTVATLSGPRAIADVRPGEWVLATDVTAGRSGAFKVQAVRAHQDPATALVTIEGDRITTTPEHRFYTREAGWVSAAHLWRGAYVVTAGGGTGAVEALVVSTAGAMMWDLTVEGAHTFYVGSGRWLVHNCAAGYRPEWVQSAGATVNWARNLEVAYKQGGYVPTEAELDELVRSAREYGVDVVRLDSPHPGTPWDVPHLKIGSAHVPVPVGYVLP